MPRRLRIPQLLITLLACAALATSVARAAVPPIMSYNGELQGAGGAPLASGSYSMKFSLYSTPTSGTPIWTEVHNGVVVTGGSFHVLLGSKGPATLIGVPFDKPYFLGVSVGSDPEMTPRQPLVTLPYTFRAGLADQVANGSITTEKIGPVAVTDEKVKSVSWAKLTGIPSALVSILTPTSGSDGVPANVWSLKGNRSSNPPSEFLGTTDAKPLVIKVNNQVMMNLLVGGPIKMTTGLDVAGDFTVGGNSWFHGTVDVDRATSLHSTLDVAGATTLRNTLGVTGATSLLSTLDVAGAATLQNTLGVTGATSLLSTLDVAGAATLQNTLGVTGATSLLSSLTVNGPTALQSTLDVAGKSTLAELKVTGATEFANLMVSAPASAGEFPDHNNKYITFASSSGVVHGRIEGQTSAELHDSFDYGWWITMEALEAAFQAAQAICDVVDVNVCSAVVDGLEFGKVIAQWGKVYVHLENTVGITYESGSGDYAEWLRRENVGEQCSFGDIVGVKGGAISKSTSTADHCLVVSMSPIVLGNMPPKGREADYEKVAFMGQVPVRVKGRVNVGDYIVPSGADDGYGKAIAKSLMSTAQYRQVVGIAWSGRNLDLGSALINVAIGIAPNMWVDKMSEQEAEIIRLKGDMNNIVAYLKSKDPSFVASTYDMSAAMVINHPSDAGLGAPICDKGSESRTRKQLDDVKNALRHQLPRVSEALAAARQSLASDHVDLEKFPKLKRLFEDPSYFVESIGNDPDSFR